MIRITGVVISKNVQNKQQFRKVWKHCKSYKRCDRRVENDDLNCACHSMMRITGVAISKKSKLAKQTGISKSLKNTVNLLYTVCAMSEMMI